MTISISHLIFAALLVFFLASPARAAFQGNLNFRNVAITNAAEHRTDWRSCTVDCKMDWSKAEVLGEGVVYLPLKLTTEDGWARRMYCHAVRVDTSKPNVRFTGSDRCAGWSEPNRELNPDNVTVLKNTVREKTADFIARFRGKKDLGGRELNMIFSANGQEWGPSSDKAPDGKDYTFGSGWAQIHCIDYADGLRISNEDRAFGRGLFPGLLVVWKDGSVDIVDELTEADVSRVWRVLSPLMCRLMRDGEIAVTCYDSHWGIVPYENTSVRPRTAYGVSSDKRYLYVVVIDGDAESTWSLGATMTDAAKVMKAAGCHQALNMDGGGSSNIVSWDEILDRPKVLGRPSGGFSVVGQRDGGSQFGVYHAPVLATVGGWRYDNADALVDDIENGKIPTGIKEADVIDNLVFSSEKPTLSACTDFIFSSTNNASIGWTAGEGRVAAGTHIGFRGIRFASGSRTISVAATGRIVVSDCMHLEKIKTEDSESFILGGALRGLLTIDCASARAAGTTFGYSELSYDDTLHQLTNLVCATASDLMACAEQTGGRIALKWGGITFSENGVRVRRNDAAAVVTVGVAAVSPAIDQKDLKLMLTVANEDGTSVDTYAQTFTGVGSYRFTLTGSGFGYTYYVTLVDGSGKELPNVGSTEGLFTFGTETEWFAADLTSGVSRGGDWTREGLFTASESGKTGRVRIVAEVVLNEENAFTAAQIEEKFAGIKDGETQSSLVLELADSYGAWRGLSREEGEIRYLALNGAEVAFGDPLPFIVVTEIDFSSGRPRVRYFAGLKSSGAVMLLSDSAGRTAFDGAGKNLTARGIVSLSALANLKTIVGYHRTKGTGTMGLTVFLR